ncbi:hypothetical protein SDC9_211683 [bioreactor metagenome]|uniref:ACT domain-containing protein n=1 Tax=bioreactor metagenome TaxID=1076179 RepID=A0A645JKG9_9ZZZZ
MRNAGLTVAITDVIGLRIPDCPGGLAEALKFLADKGFTVEYAYAFIEKTENDAYVVLRIDDAERAVKVLKANGYKGAEPSKQ